MSLSVFAGTKALKRIQEEGLSADQVRLIVGASGGPKWLVLSKLDQYLNTEFLPKAEQPIELIGSSIGAWRMACYAQKDPVKAIERLRDAYSTTAYPTTPTPADVTKSAYDILEAALGSDQKGNAQHGYIVNNETRPLHVVTVRNRQPFSFNSKLAQGVSVGLAALSNPFSARAVEKIFPRVVFSQDVSSAPYRDKNIREQVKLTEENLSPALMASGAIPFVLDPIKVPGSKPLWHWDGGIVDYHFEGPFKQSDDLVLYPHFFPKLIPGWLDKGLPWRRASAEKYDNVVVVCPTNEFIESLPDQHIPDRKDFTGYDTETRLRNWQTVIAESEALADSFDSAMNKDQFRSAVRPLSELGL